MDDKKIEKIIDYVEKELSSSGSCIVITNGITYVAQKSQTGQVNVEERYNPHTDQRNKDITKTIHNI